MAVDRLELAMSVISGRRGPRFNNPLKPEEWAALGFETQPQYMQELQEAAEKVIVGAIREACGGAGK